MLLIDAIVIERLAKTGVSASTSDKPERGLASLGTNMVAPGKIDSSLKLNREFLGINEEPFG